LALHSLLVSSAARGILLLFPIMPSRTWVSVGRVVCQHQKQQESTLVPPFFSGQKNDGSFFNVVSK
jgi:hypothetical protein